MDGVPARGFVTWGVTKPAEDMNQVLRRDAKRDMSAGHVCRFAQVWETCARHESWMASLRAQCGRLPQAFRAAPSSSHLEPGAIRAGALPNGGALGAAMPYLCFECRLSTLEAVPATGLSIGLAQAPRKGGVGGGNHLIPPPDEGLPSYLRHSATVRSLCM